MSTQFDVRDKICLRSLGAMLITLDDEEAEEEEDDDDEEEEEE